jgi:hypothetical protein
VDCLTGSESRDNLLLESSIEKLLRDQFMEQYPELYYLYQYSGTSEFGQPFQWCNWRFNNAEIGLG